MIYKCSLLPYWHGINTTPSAALPGCASRHQTQRQPRDFCDFVPLRERQSRRWPRVLPWHEE